METNNKHRNLYLHIYIKSSLNHHQALFPGQTEVPREWC